MNNNQLKKNTELIQAILYEKNSLEIDIINNKFEKIGRLKPVTISTPDNENIIEKITKWRNNSMQFFLTQFIASNIRTKKWILNTLLKDNQRLFFIIYDNLGNPIGNFGFIKLNENSAEIDNLIRGERLGSPQIIYFAELALIEWMFSILKIDEIKGFVFSNNIIPILLHKEVGFLINEKIPVFKNENNNEIQWSMQNTSNNNAETKFLYEILLNRENFVGN